MSSSSDRSRFRLPGPTVASPILIPATLASLGGHAALALLLVGGLFHFVKKFPTPPEQAATIEIVEGNGGVSSKAVQPPPAAAEPPPPQEAQPPAPTAEPAIAKPPAPPQPDGAVPTPTAPPARPRTAQPVPRPPPKPAPPRTATPSPESRPVPTQPTPPAPSAESVQLGGGVDDFNGKIIGRGGLIPAERGKGNRPPVYPLSAARRHEQGTVVLRIAIDVIGNVSGVDIVRSSGYRDLDDSARNQIMTWHFRPATKDGLPVPDTEEQEINFSVE